MRVMRRVVCIGLALFAALPATADATVPGRNGKILFAAYDGLASLRVMNLDGSGNHQIYGPGDFTLGRYDSVMWSHDGRRIIFGSGDIRVMDADGSNVKVLVGDPATDRNPGWSPDASQIVFDRVFGPSSDRHAIPFVAAADGSNAHQLFRSSVCAGVINSCDPRPVWSAGNRIALEGDRDGSRGLWSVKPDGSDPIKLDPWSQRYLIWDWSPDGRQLAFTRIEAHSAPVGTTEELYVVNADGTGVRHVMSLGNFYGDRPNGSVSWAPDGTKIISSRKVLVGSDITSDLFTINPDGSGFTQLTANGNSYYPLWQPLPLVTPPPSSGPPARLVISRRAVRMSKRGVAAVRVSCKSPGAGGSCAGKLKLVTAKRFAVGGEPPKRVVLGSTGFRIARGRTVLVKVRVSRAARRLVARRGKLAVRATGTVTRASGRAASFKASFVVRS